MSKTCVFTTITPLPAGITRQSVIEMYHNHVEMIELNPLVVERFRCKAPNYAPAEEYYSTWYTIKDKVSYLPAGLATGSVSYHAVFHDLPDSLQTHVYAPLGLDIRAKWSVGGQLPGEPKQPVELGLGAPREGLYIREDVRMKCNIMMLSFVKKTFKESHAKLVDRLVEKAHVRESSIANERLKALRGVAPRERMGHGDIFIAPPPGYQSPTAPMYPKENNEMCHSETAPMYLNDHGGQENYHHSPAPKYSNENRNSETYHYHPPAPMYSNESSGNESNHSPMPSPGLSQASTLTSQSSYLSSPPYQPTEINRKAVRDSFNFQFDQKPVQSPEQPNLLLLPATTYDPTKKRTEDLRRDSTTLGAFHAFQPHIMELDDERRPPVPSKDKYWVAELPA